MPSDRFLMDNGGGHTTRLWRTAGTGRHYVWRDAPPGEPYEIQFDDDAGTPVDCFGLPVFGNLIAEAKKDIDER